MRALVVYESMYGNTHLIAEAIARGLRSDGSVQVASVADARYEDVHRYDLLVVGGPTHAHGMSRTETRQSALAAAEREPDHLPHLEPDAGGMGLRTWLDMLGLCDGRAAAFDTRRHGPRLLTGHASKGIAGMLHEHGFHLVAEPISFIVDGHDHLLAGEVEQAERWGVGLAATMPSSQDPPSGPA
jgi:hypothetical protein